MVTAGRCPEAVKGSLLEAGGGDVDAVPGNASAHLLSDLPIREPPENATQCLRKGGDITAWIHLFYAIYQVGARANAVRDDWEGARRHRLVDHDSPRLVVTGQHQDVCRVVVRRKICLIDETGDNSPARRQRRPYPIGQYTVSDKSWPAPQRIRYALPFGSGVAD